MTIKEVLDCPKFTDITICRLAAAKGVPAFMVGCSWRFSRSGIDGWISQPSMEGAGPKKSESGDTE